MLYLFKLYIHLRRFSTKTQGDVKSKVELIKKLNYENKALFGRVQKEKKGNISVPKENQAEIELSSEIYWLLQHKSAKQSDEKENQKSSNTEGKTRKIKARTVNKTQKSVKNKKSNSDEVVIPFNKKDLKSILKFPLITIENNKTLGNETSLDIASHYPSVSKILQSTMSEAARKALMNWKLTKISELGEEGFNKLQQDHLQRGKMLHSALQSYLVTGIQPEIQPQITELWVSVLPALASLQPKAELTEAQVEHPYLKYKGVVDCVSRIGNDISVIEWKKSDKQKTTIESTFDAPIQLAAYLGALSADPRYNIVANHGYIVVAYSDKKPAEVHHMDDMQLKKYWDIWLKKVQEYWIRTRDGTLPEPL